MTDRLAEPAPDYLLKPQDRFKWTEGVAQKALTNCLDVHTHQTFPNVMLGGGEMDMAVLTKAGYLMEIEIKLSAADWRADKHKDKWLPKYAQARRIVKHFCYAVPVELMNAMPDDIDPRAGIISLFWDHQIGRPTGGRWKVWGMWAKQPRAFPGAQKLDHDTRQTLLASIYHRYWRQIHGMIVHDPRLLPMPLDTVDET